MSDAPTAYAVAPPVRARHGSRDCAGRWRLASHMSRNAMRTSSPRGSSAHPDPRRPQRERPPQTAAALLLQTRAPSWLYPVTMGATTVWERWDSLLSDGSINPGEIDFLHHYALGAVADWLYRRVAGYRARSTGVQPHTLRPHGCPRLDDASATIDTPSGTVRGGWERGDGEIRWNLTVPAHSRAEIHIPGLSPTEVEPGSYQWTTKVAAPRRSPPFPRCGPPYQKS